MDKKYKLPEYQVRFSNWHSEKLSKACLTFNLDFIEIRKIDSYEIVALIEYKQKNEELTYIEKIELPKIASKLNVPAFVVKADFDENSEMTGTADIYSIYTPSGKEYTKTGISQDLLIRFYERDLIGIYNEEKN